MRKTPWRALCWLLATAFPASAYELNGALPALRFASAPSAVAGRPVLRRRAPAQEARPDAFDENDGFRRALLAPAASERWLVPTVQGDVLLVAEKGYLDAAALDRFCADVQEAVAAIPLVTGRPSLVRGRFTLYVYDEGPMSEADVPGAEPGEKGVMLRFVREKSDPLFHELTHLLAGYSESQSLGEGLADVVQERLRPGRESAFIPAGTDPHAKARAALAAYGPPFFEMIGSPGYYRFGPGDIRFDFYYCSWSFAKFLLRQGSMADAWAVADAGGDDEAYRRVYGRGRAELVAAWMADVGGAGR